ncbi:MAG: DUF92 domain-containing protein [Chloroflexota bacterium]
MFAPTILVTLLIGLFILVIALWRGWLTRSGAAAALLVGTITLGFGGMTFVVPLLTFFITSSLFSKVQSNAKRAAAQRFDKSHQRDAMQVLANGGLGALAALGFGLTQDPRWFAFFLGAMATVTADTWATELGTLSKGPPRSLITGRVVPVGMSGGISVLGLVASIGGGMLIGAVGALAGGGALGWLMLLGGATGLIGSLLDSLLGATLQRQYWDPNRQEMTEKSARGGHPLVLSRGLSWMGNDVVNLLAAAGGGFCAALLWRASVGVLL